MLDRENLDGKLKEEQIEVCKEGNVRGVFGYPSKTEELAKEYRKNPEIIEELQTEQEYDDTEKEFKKVAKKQKIMIRIYVGILVAMIASLLIAGMLN